MKPQVSENEGGAAQERPESHKNLIANELGLTCLEKVRLFYFGDQQIKNKVNGLEDNHSQGSFWKEQNTVKNLSASSAKQQVTSKLKNANNTSVLSSLSGFGKKIYEYCRKFCRNMSWHYESTLDPTYAKETEIKNSQALQFFINNRKHKLNKNRANHKNQTCQDLEEDHQNGKLVQALRFGLDHNTKKKTKLIHRRNSRFNSKNFYEGHAKRQQKPNDNISFGNSDYVRPYLYRFQEVEIKSLSPPKTLNYQSSQELKRSPIIIHPLANQQSIQPRKIPQKKLSQKMKQNMACNIVFEEYQTEPTKNPKITNSRNEGKLDKIQRIGSSIFEGKNIMEESMHIFKKQVKKIEEKQLMIRQQIEKRTQSILQNQNYQVQKQYLFQIDEHRQFEEKDRKLISQEVLKNIIYDNGLHTLHLKEQREQGRQERSHFSLNENDPKEWIKCRSQIVIEKQNQKVNTEEEDRINNYSKSKDIQRRFPQELKQKGAKIDQQELKSCYSDEIQKVNGLNSCENKDQERDPFYTKTMNNSSQNKIPLEFGSSDANVKIHQFILKQSPEDRDFSRDKESNMCHSSYCLFSNEKQVFRINKSHPIQSSMVSQKENIEQEEDIPFKASNNQFVPCNSRLEEQQQIRENGQELHHSLEIQEANIIFPNTSPHEYLYHENKFLIAAESPKQTAQFLGFDPIRQIQSRSDLIPEDSKRKCAFEIEKEYQQRLYQRYIQEDQASQNFTPSQLQYLHSCLEEIVDQNQNTNCLKPIVINRHTHPDLTKVERSALLMNLQEAKELKRLEIAEKEQFNHLCSELKQLKHIFHECRQKYKAQVGDTKEIEKEFEQARERAKISLEELENQSYEGTEENWPADFQDLVEKQRYYMIVIGSYDNALLEQRNIEQSLDRRMNKCDLNQNQDSEREIKIQDHSGLLNQQSSGYLARKNNQNTILDQQKLTASSIRQKHPAQQKDEQVKVCSLQEDQIQGELPESDNESNSYIISCIQNIQAMLLQHAPQHRSLNQKKSVQPKVPKKISSPENCEQMEEQQDSILKVKALSNFLETLQIENKNDGVKDSFLPVTHRSVQKIQPSQKKYQRGRESQQTPEMAFKRSRKNVSENDDDFVKIGAKKVKQDDQEEFESALHQWVSYTPKKFPTQGQEHEHEHGSVEQDEEFWFSLSYSS